MASHPPVPPSASPSSPVPSSSVPPLPALEDLLARAHVVDLPMRVKFRGILQREALLLEGPLGWGEFCPFPEYGDAEASRWLAAALEAGWQGFPEPLRTVIPVNATVPAIAADRVPEILARFGRVDAVKIKVAEPGQTLDDDTGDDDGDDDGDDGTGGFGATGQPASPAPRTPAPGPAAPRRETPTVTSVRWVVSDSHGNRNSTSRNSTPARSSTESTIRSQSGPGS